MKFKEIHNEHNLITKSTQSLHKVKLKKTKINKKARLNSMEKLNEKYVYIIKASLQKFLPSASGNTQISAKHKGINSFISDFYLGQIVLSFGWVVLKTRILIYFQSEFWFTILVEKVKIGVYIVSCGGSHFFRMPFGSLSCQISSNGQGGDLRDQDDVRLALLKECNWRMRG
ncbi:MAG: hypothetical protein Ta2E_10840 [Mycoplasmoidaceae bacterium]|nr:MAG: hypothetical protein Ta2E_10840 [Mycoplasmoidaceae bacterium]